MLKFTSYFTILMGRYISYILFPGLLLFTFLSPAVAQQTGIIRGVIMERGTTSRLAEAEVVNKKTSASVLSNNFGLFQIGGAVGDTLLVFKTEFSNAEVAVISEKDMVIYLNRGTNLREVNITTQSKKQELDEMRKEYRDKGSFYAGKPPFLSYLFTPLTAIYELFGRTPKNAKRFGKYATTELQQTEIDGFFNESLIKKNTPLQGKALEKFMLDYRPDYEKSKNWAEYDAIKYIRDAYKKYADTLQTDTLQTTDTIKLKQTHLKRINFGD